MHTAPNVFYNTNSLATRDNYDVLIMQPLAQVQG